MAKYCLNGKWYTTAELSELSGIAPHTLRDRLRRGYSIEQAVRPALTDISVEQFSEASWWEDWLGMSINDIHTIYWKWCISHEYTPLPKQSFSRHLMHLYPQLKSTPNRTNEGSMRVIRLRG